MQFLKQFIFLISAAIWIHSAIAEQLTIHMEPPSLYKRASGGSRWDVFLEGVIDPQAHVRVQHELNKLGSADADVYLNSPGGNLLAGIELGKVLRKAGTSTHIGKKVGGLKDIQPGSCMSSCSLAFLGGVYRFMPKDSVYGVHRVFSTSESSTNDLDVGQILSAAISNYIREMGVEPELFDRMVRAGKDEIYLLTPTETVSLLVVNNGRQRAEWSIEASQGMQYLRGAQQTIYGMGKALFSCIKGSLILHSIYEAGPMAESIANGQWEHSLMINSDILPLPPPTRLLNDNGYINAIFALTPSQVRSVYTANSVGHSMQLSRDAPTFIGYRVDIAPSAAKRVRGFIDNCMSPLE